jgi:hypothetical protein
MVDLHIQSGQQRTITQAELSLFWGLNTSSTDPAFFALREQGQDGQLGVLVAEATAGSLTFKPTEAPRVLWLMNASNGTDYACAWAAGLGQRGIWRGRRYATATLADTLPVGNVFHDMTTVMRDPTPILQGLDLMNAAWLVGGVEYARITYAAGVGDPDMSFAWATGGACVGNDNYAGCHGYGGVFVVNPGAPEYFYSVAAVEEATETYFLYDDLCGEDTNRSLFANYHLPLTARGIDYLRFGALMAKP